MKLLMLKSYYGINIHGDSQGDLGTTVYDGYVNPDLIFIMAATIANNADNIDLQVIDSNADKILPDELICRLENTYDCIILKSSAPVIKLDIELAKRLKKIYPNCKMLLAGHIAKLLKKWIIENEKAIDEVVDIPLDFYMYKYVNDTSIVDVNKFPSPDYTLFPYEKYLDSGNVRLSIQTSRGCMMQCGYCPYSAFYDNKIYFIDIEKVIQDLKIVLKLKPKIILFRDQYFTADKNRIEYLCHRIIEENLNFRWTCETKLDLLDTELIDLMIKAGLFMICYGIESGEHKILDAYNRKYDRHEHTKDIISYLNSNNVLTLAFYIIGFPEDTWDSVEKTFNLALELNSRISQFSPFEPCVTYDKEELTPDSFCIYKNTMQVETHSNLSKDEVDYIIDSFTKICSHNVGELENNYKYEFSYKQKHLELIKELLPLGSDLDEICSYIREKVTN